MLQTSFISDKAISRSLSKLKQVSSDKKFRVKSLRLKTLQSPSKSSQKSQNKSSLKVEQDILKKLGFSTALPSINSHSKNKQIRVKSVQQPIEKNYEQQLIDRLEISKQILNEIYLTKLEQEDIKPSHDKYLNFLKGFYMKIVDRVELQIQSFNFKVKSLQKFLCWYLTWQKKPVISLDLSHCYTLTSQMAKTSIEQEIKTIEKEKIKNSHLFSSPNQTRKQTPSESRTAKVSTPQQRKLFVQKENSLQGLTSSSEHWPNSLLEKVILLDKKLCKLSLRNIKLSPEQFTDILEWSLESKRIYSLDLSNKSSQSINRIGSDYFHLQQFFARNELIGVVKLDNLNITHDCIESISRGFLRNTHFPIRILSLSNNLISSKSHTAIYNIVRNGGVTELNLSNNPLGYQFFLNFKSWRASVIRILDLTSTMMNSESLIHFLQQIIESKHLEILKLDRNDFSHHWFNKIKEIFQDSFSVGTISMVDCGIKNFVSMFEGLTYSKYLKKLNINYNLIDAVTESEDIGKICDCFKHNKSLEEIRIRFCGFGEKLLREIFQAMSENTTIKGIDISENQYSDTGVRQIESLLNKAQQVEWIGLQKVQITFKNLQSIQKTLKYNKSLRDKKELENLKRVNKNYRSKDTVSWKEIEVIEAEAKKMHYKIVEAKSKNDKLESRIAQKKTDLTEVKRYFKDEQRKAERDLKRQENVITINMNKTKALLKKMDEQQKQRLQNMEIERRLIQTLETKIDKTNQKIKQRENALEQQLREENYVKKKHKKQEGGKFDNTKSMKGQSKRKGVIPALEKGKKSHK